MTVKTNQGTVKAESDQNADIDKVDRGRCEATLRGGIFNRLQRFSHRKFPSVIPHPDRAEILRNSRGTDDRDNAETEPHVDEAIDTRCIWAVELYTPSQISELLQQFEKLGWNRNDPAMPIEVHNPVHWIQRYREAARGSGYFNLGPLHRHGDSRFFHHGREAPLPEGVDYALAYMYSLTSSVSCIVIGFLLDEHQGRRFEDALRLRRQTMLEPMRGGGFRLPGPPHLKEADIKRIRGDLRAMASNWFRAHLPGVFAGDALAGEYPTCEFTTLRNTIPCPGREYRNPRADRWLELLNIDDDTDAWESERLPNLKFVWPLFRDPENRYHAVLTCSEDTVPNDKLRTYGGDRTSYAIYVDQYVNGLLSRWSLLGLLTGYERRLNATRDSAIFGYEKRAKVLRHLEMLRGHLAQSVDISAAAADLKNLSEQRRPFLRAVETFKPCDPRSYGNEEITLGEALRRQIGERSGWLRKVDGTVRGLLMEHGMVLSAHENIKVQRHMVILTWLIAVLTIMITVLTVFTAAVSIKSGSLSWPW